MESEIPVHSSTKVFKFQYIPVHFSQLKHGVTVKNEGFQQLKDCTMVEEILKIIDLKRNEDFQQLKDFIMVEENFENHRSETHRIKVFNN